MKRSAESRPPPLDSIGLGKDDLGIPTNRPRELNPALRGWNWERAESVVGLGFNQIGLDKDCEREIAEAIRGRSYREQVDWIRAHLAEPDNCRRLLKDDESLDWWLQAIDLLDAQQPRPIDIKRGRVSIDSLRDSNLPPYSPGWEASLDQTAGQSLTLVNLWRWLQIEEQAAHRPPYPTTWYARLHNWLTAAGAYAAYRRPSSHSVAPPTPQVFTQAQARATEDQLGKARDDYRLAWGSAHKNYQGLKETQLEQFADNCARESDSQFVPRPPGRSHQSACEDLAWSKLAWGFGHATNELAYRRAAAEAGFGRALGASIEAPPTRSDLELDNHDSVDEIWVGPPPKPRLSD